MFRSSLTVELKQVVPVIHTNSYSIVVLFLLVLLHSKVNSLIWSGKFHLAIIRGELFPVRKGNSFGKRRSNIVGSVVFVRSILFSCGSDH